MKIFPLFICFLISTTSAILTGHLKQLGEQRLFEGHVEILETIPDVKTFFQRYISESKPVLFKDAANNMPAFKLWTDEYLM